VAAVMFADMVGYSQRMEQDEERSSTQAARSVALLKSLIGDYGGKIANVAGDGILALFPDADRALSFAFQIQNEFRDHAVWAEGDPIKFRVGLHLGEVREDNENVWGHCVNVAARIQQVAEPGSIVVTSRIRDALRHRPKLYFRPLGRPVLKNLTESIDVFAVAEPSDKEAQVIEATRLREEPEPPRYPSVAVLALTNLCRDPADEHLCKGIVEDIITNLSRFRSLIVIARHSAFLFDLGTTPASEIGRRLGVHYILGGSLRRSEKRLRVSVELIKAEFESVVWSDRFDINLGDLFNLQDEITGAVASRLSVQIDIAERRRESSYPRDMRAYGLVLRGCNLTFQYRKEANALARRLFEEAIQNAPDYGRAYSALSRSHNLDWRYSWSLDPDKSLDSAVRLAHSAIEHDPLEAQGFAALGFAHLYKKMHSQSLADYQRALALNPNDADIVAEYADALVYVGRLREAEELLERAMRLNPYYPDWYLWNLADVYDAMGRYNDVIEAVLRMRNPDEGRRLLAASYAHLDMLDEARAQAKEVMRVHPEFRISQWRSRPPHTDRALLERLVEGFRKAGLPE
jgi:TolB-like protein/class 3 adenylate cyclase/Tfp pilus assembly protein PilF